MDEEAWVYTSLRGSISRQLSPDAVRRYETIFVSRRKDLFKSTCMRNVVSSTPCLHSLFSLGRKINCHLQSVCGIATAVNATAVNAIAPNGHRTRDIVKRASSVSVGKIWPPTLNQQ